MALMSVGDIRAVIHSLEFDTDTCYYPSLVHVSGDIYAVAYQGPAGDGFLKTVNIDTIGNIGSVIDSLNFDTTTVNYCHLIHISGNIYAVAYQSLPTADGFLKTVSIATDGNIGVVIDTLEFDTDYCSYPSLIHVSGDIYAVAYQGPGNDGFLKTMSIDTDGNISTVIDTLDFETDICYYPHLVHISGAIYAIAYKGSGGDGWLKTMSIDTAGNIGAVIDSLEFDTSLCDYPFLIHISGNVYAIAYRGPSADGFLKTMSIDTAGNIGTVIDTLEFDTDYCSEPHLIHISMDAYAVAYRGSGGDGWLKTVSIVSNGDIGAVIDSLEFDTDYCHDPHLIHISGDIYAIAYQGPDIDGWLKTLDIESLSIPTVTTDPATGLGARAATLNGTLDDDGGEACDCGFEWGETIAYGNTTPTLSNRTGESFAKGLLSLAEGTTYHFRAFATNSAGTAYGSDRTIATRRLKNRAYALAREDK